MTAKSIFVGVTIALVSGAVATGAVNMSNRSNLDDVENRLKRALDAAQEARDEADDVSQSVDDLETRVDKLRRRWNAARVAGRIMGDCVAKVSDEGTTGTREVIFVSLSVTQGSNRELLVDAMEWYSGEAANRQALEDGEIEPGDSVPNDYYIRNPEREETLFPVAEDATVVTTTASRHNIPSPRCKGWNGFVGAWRDPKPWQESILRSPYWLTIDDGKIVRLVEQYLP